MALEQASRLGLKRHPGAPKRSTRHAGPQGLDRWTVDETGTISNVTDGCRWSGFHAFGPG